MGSRGQGRRGRDCALPLAVRTFGTPALLRTLALLCLLLAAFPVFAQGYHVTDVVTSQTGQPVSNATITVCPGAQVSGSPPLPVVPCVGLQPIFYDPGLTLPAPNPFQSDGQGNYGYYVAVVNLTETISGTNVNSSSIIRTIPCVPGGAGCGGGGGGGITLLESGQGIQLFPPSITATGIVNAAEMQVSETNSFVFSPTVWGNNYVQFAAGNTTATLPGTSAGFPVNGWVNDLTNRTSASGVIALTPAAGAHINGSTSAVNIIGGNGVRITSDGAGNYVTLPFQISTSGGTVTSVGLTAPATLLTVGGSPVTGAGTLTLALANAGANKWFGNDTAGTATPGFFNPYAGSIPVNGNCLQASVTLGVFLLADSGGPCGGSGGVLTSFDGSATPAAVLNAARDFVAGAGIQVTDTSGHYPITVTNTGSPLGNLGDILSVNGTPQLVAVPGNITTNYEVFCQTGTGSVSAVPAWCAPTATLPIVIAPTTGVTSCPTCATTWDTILGAAGNLNISNANKTTTFHQTLGGALWSWISDQAATTGVPTYSPEFILQGNRWNSSNSIADLFDFEVEPNSTDNLPSALLISHVSSGLSGGWVVVPTIVSNVNAFNTGGTGTKNVDLSNGNTIEATCSSAGAAITFTASNYKAGEIFDFTFIQNATPCTVAWPANFHNAPTVNPIGSSVTTALFETNNAGTDAYYVGNNPTNISGATYATATHCVSGASPALCGSAAAGSVAVPAGVNQTLVVNTSAVTANSQILLTNDESATVTTTTCNTTAASLALTPFVTARTPATSFTIELLGTTTTNPVCVNYTVIN